MFVVVILVLYKNLGWIDILFIIFLFLMSVLISICFIFGK